MESFFTTIPGIIIAVASAITILATAFFYGVGIWKGKKDNADDRLITILQTTVTELEKTVKKQTTDIEALGKKVSALERENETLVKVLQGRDQQTQKFYEQGFESMKKTNEIYECIETLVKTVEHLGQSLEKNNEMTSEFVKTMKDHFLNVEKVAISKQ